MTRPPAAGPGATVTSEDARAKLIGWDLAVPASTANLGPGFDSLALALQLYLRVKVSEVSGTATNGLSFDLCGMPLSGDNYIERAFRSMAGRDQVTFPSLSFEVRSEIPMRGGLGSSAAATVAGLRIYERLTARPDIDDLLTVATRLDQHADNVSAALLGGLTLSCVTDSGRVIARAIRWPSEIRAVVAMPSVEVATPEARKVLPAAYPLEDAVFNLQRALLFVHAIERGDYAVLREAMRDRWHQPQRATIIPGLDAALVLDHPSLVGVCLSGSGPAVVAFATGAFDEIERLLLGIYNRLGVPCQVRTVSAHQPGAKA
jgi:homoserine kinase